MADDTPLTVTQLTVTPPPATLVYARRDGTGVVFFDGSDQPAYTSLDRMDRAILRAIVAQVIDTLDAADAEHAARGKS